jgi:hypothetical protein
MDLFKQFRYPTNRQALVVAIASATLLLTLVILWLAVSTRTALLSRQLDDYDARQAAANQEEANLWAKLGEITAPQAMERRMQEAGFAPPKRLEFLVPAAVSPTPSSTVTNTAALNGGGQ